MADVILNHLSAANLFDLGGVIVVITGGGTGIGLMIATTLVANGATVYIIGPKQADLDKIAKVYNDAAHKISSKGRIYGLEGDVRQKSEAIRLAQEIGKREKYITALFNNAGIAGTSSTYGAPEEPTAASFIKKYFDPVSQADFNNVLNTNAVGPYWLTFAFLPLLEAWKNSAQSNLAAAKFVPQIIMTSSMNGWTKDSATSGRSWPYMYSKSAIGHATSSLAHELLPLGIRVNGIAPGWFQTEMTAPGTQDAVGLSHYGPEEAAIEFNVPAIPTGGTNRDMGALALFLIANWFINGETILIDGGTLLKHPSSY
ncbi:hypothetical protein PILCRDRAFT_815958 [Piloderma croceum F 1598]|uniref:NAD(P)-binding protein n=1 Tax=Piloderma croceum (strain F 1598) TaxID=765440 RepID=A0A0C3G7S1_PILCF|nr:hypothetical protein PILCRDRAFT_815958 [Piloderma croceum F 1598]